MMRGLARRRSKDQGGSLHWVSIEGWKDNRLMHYGAHDFMEDDTLIPKIWHFWRMYRGCHVSCGGGGCHKIRRMVIRKMCLADKRRNQYLKALNIILNLFVRNSRNIKILVSSHNILEAVNFVVESLFVKWQKYCMVKVSVLDLPC